MAAGALTIGLGGLAACADGEAAKQVSGAVDVVDVTAAPGETAADVGIIEQGYAQACDADRKTLELASEAFYAMNGSYPSAEADLVAAGLLRSESEGMDLAGDGSIVPAPGSHCA